MICQAMMNRSLTFDVLEIGLKQGVRRRGADRNPEEGFRDLGKTVGARQLGHLAGLTRRKDESSQTKC